MYVNKSSSRKLRWVIYYTLYRMDYQKRTIYTLCTGWILNKLAIYYTLYRMDPQKRTIYYNLYRMDPKHIGYL